MSATVEGAKLTPRWWWYGRTRTLITLCGPFGPIEAKDQATAARVAQARAESAGLKFDSVERCPDCDGSGLVDTTARRCAVCDGDGHANEPRAYFDGESCPECRGTGTAGERC